METTKLVTIIVQAKSDLKFTLNGIGVSTLKEFYSKEHQIKLDNPDIYDSIIKQIKQIEKLNNLL